MIIRYIVLQYFFTCGEHFAVHYPSGHGYGAVPAHKNESRKGQQIPFRESAVPEGYCPHEIQIIRSE
jgi:hypothetical protein